MDKHFEEQLHHYLSGNEHDETMNAIRHVISDGDGVRQFVTQGEAVFVSRLDYEKMCDTLLAFKLSAGIDSCYYVVIPSPEDDLLVAIFSTKPKTSQHLDPDNFKSHFLDAAHNIICPVWVDESRHDRNLIQLQCANVSHFTFFPNLLEIISKNEIHTDEIHIAQAVNTGSRTCSRVSRQKSSSSKTSTTSASIPLPTTSAVTCKPVSSR